ncbi:MAG: YraN family protein [Clostridiaceae bacterium]|nr:YraN family protein [Clostridiaceae bacterium]
MNTWQLGKKGETFAVEYLIKKDYKILRQNYRAGRLGEIDLIVFKNNRIFFIEVKSRTGDSFGTPAEAVSYKKQGTIKKVASCFLKEYGTSDVEVQFDVIEIIMTKDGKLVDVNHIEEAF